MECELGRWVRQFITLNNPTDELLNLIPTISNTNNFKLERDTEQPFELQPHSNLRLPVTFMPSTLGPGDHKARIAFHCEQVPIKYYGKYHFLCTYCAIILKNKSRKSIVNHGC
jgi:hypothetical protein